MISSRRLSRRALIGALGVSGLAAGTRRLLADRPTGRTYRIGVISASIRGKPQPRNGHTWHFAQYFHPVIDFDAAKKHYPYYLDHYRFIRDPRHDFDQLPFSDTRITHYYDADPQVAVPFTEVFPGVTVARSLEEMVREVDAVWLGDASGEGQDHFDLVAPGLERGLPTFCDKPIGGTVAQTRRILEFARQHQAPIMSSSLFRHQWGAEAALRMRDSGKFGTIEYIIATLQSRYRPEGWMVYGQHPVWTVMTLLGPGVEAVSMYAQRDASHTLITYPDRMPADVWYGQPYEVFEYCRTDVYFQKKLYSYTPSIEGDFAFGHHYEMFRMAATFRQMIKTRQEPIPHQEILEVTSIIHAGARSLAEKSRLVRLDEVAGE